MRNSFSSDLLRFMLTPTKFPVSPYYVFNIYNYKQKKSPEPVTLEILICSAYGTRTRVPGVRGRYPNH